MYLRDLADSLMRRWILVVAAVAMTGGVCFAAARMIPVTHETRASIVLVPPKDVKDPTANRFLSLSNLTQAADVLVRALDADTTREIVHTTAPDGTYEVAVDDGTSAPVVVITAKAATADEAETLVDTVLQQAPESLTALQSALSIAPGAEITSIPLTRDVDPQVIQKTRMRAVVALGVLCLAGAAVLIAALDGMLLMRAARKDQERRRDGPPPAADDEQEDDVWLENELVTISSAALEKQPASKRTRRRESRDPTSQDRE